MKKPMKQIWLVLIGLLFLMQPSRAEVVSVPDSVYLFTYATVPDLGRSGLKMAWSPNLSTWFSIGNGFAFVSSDYGAWGPHKHMIEPIVTHENDGSWVCYWKLTDSGKAWAKATSQNLCAWNPQIYYMTEQAPQPTSQMVAAEVLLNGETEHGYYQKVDYKLIESLIQYAEHQAYRTMQNQERTEQDIVRFAGLEPVNAVVEVSDKHPLAISDKLIGIFFEDISYAADGGLYAEMVQNRDFEYSKADKSRIIGWGPQFAWSTNNKIQFSIAEDNPIHENNPHYAVLDVKEEGGTFVNAGFDGFALKAGEKYIFSFFSKKMGPTNGKVWIRLVEAGQIIAEKRFSVNSSTWKKQEGTLVAQADAKEAELQLVFEQAGQFAVDMVSLFPQNTFKGHRNGLRADLAQVLADLHPRFVRFPGGCLAHGDGIENWYDWKGSVGPLEARKPMRNIWNYHQTRGLGYYEYLQFCEDIGAYALPILPAGVPCQNSSTPGKYSVNEVTMYGQQGGLPMEEMGDYIQDIFDLIEYCNGSVKTTWGKKRAQDGHPKPFNLKYLGIGNEDLISPVFEERFEMIYKAVREKYPEIIVVGTVGPFYEGSDYTAGWKLADRLNIPIVDEHYYNPPGWFVNNQDYYDRYDRSKTKVYLGEYAAHLPGRPNNIETALAEALYLTAVERNGDIVEMTSYAPLFGKEGHTNWNPNLIYFNNTEYRLTTDYYVQQLYGQNGGTQYLPSNIRLDNQREDVRKRFGMSVVRDEKTGDVILKLVNMLPVNVNTQMNIPSIKDMQTTAVKTVLSGKPTDKDAKPVVSEISISPDFSYQVPPYSFTVIRVKK